MKRTLVLLTLTWAVVAAAAEQEGGSIRQAHADAVAWILSKVPCDNAEEVALRVFGESRDSIFALPDCRLSLDFRVQDLGDGTTAFILEPPGGNGNWAHIPNYHFVKVGTELQLIFDGGGVYTEHLDRGPKFNGRYLIASRWRADSGERSGDGSITLVYHTAYFFWDGSRYVKAYTQTETFEAKDPEKKKLTVEWHEAGGKGFLSARVTWEHEVRWGDTLSAISHRYGTDIDEVVSQNGIEEPDVISTGQFLRYDSSRTENGRHANPTLH